MIDIFVHFKERGHISGFPLVRFTTKAVGKAERAPAGKIQDAVLVGFESRPVRLHLIFKLRVLTTSERRVFLDKDGTEHM